MPQYLRAYRDNTQRTEDGQPIRFVASTEGVKRDGLDIKVGDWFLGNYERNPVVLWVHDYMGRNLPVGKANAFPQGKNLVADVSFDLADTFAAQIDRKYRAGFLNAVSVGWDTTRGCDNCGTWSSIPWFDSGRVCPSCKREFPRDAPLRNELLDISAVPIPADPDALMERQQRAYHDLGHELLELSERKAIPVHTTDKAPEDTAWDGPAQVAMCEAMEGPLRKMHAWVDDSMDANTKRAYKLPHHLASGDVVWRGVAAAMGRLMQGGTNIPDADRRGVYDHLAAHYRQFDKTPPEFRSYDEPEEQWHAATPETTDDSEVVEALRLATARLQDISPYLQRLPLDYNDALIMRCQDVLARAGAVLSSRNKGDLEQAITLIQGVLDRATKEEDKQTEERSGVDAALADLHEYLMKIGGN